jgi:hypothetical protein
MQIQEQQRQQQQQPQRQQQQRQQRQGSAGTANATGQLCSALGSAVLFVMQHTAQQCSSQHEYAHSLSEGTMQCQVTAADVCAVPAFKSARYRCSSRVLVLLLLTLQLALYMLGQSSKAGATSAGLQAQSRSMPMLQLPPRSRATPAPLGMLRMWKHLFRHGS